MDGRGSDSVVTAKSKGYSTLCTVSWTRDATTFVRPARGSSYLPPHESLPRPIKERPNLLGSVIFGIALWETRNMIASPEFFESTSVKFDHSLSWTERQKGAEEKEKWKGGERHKMEDRRNMSEWIASVKMLSETKWNVLSSNFAWDSCISWISIVVFYFRISTKLVTFPVC